jgi:hypothetical protein
VTRLLALDFDGVLNSARFYDKKHPGVLPLDPAAVQLLNTLLDRSGALVVVSSTWRLGDDLMGLWSKLESVGFRGKVVGVTPDLSRRPKVSKIYRPVPRGEEIQAFVDEWEAAREPIESLVILDDDPDMAHLSHRLVQTNFREGLTIVHVDRAVRMLADGTDWRKA